MNDGPVEKKDGPAKTVSVTSKIDDSPGAFTVEHLESKAAMSKMLSELLSKIKENNLEAVKAIYDEFKGYNLDFVLNNELETLAP